MPGSTYGPHQYIKLSQLNDQIQDAVNDRFKGQTYWVVADITNHSYKADKKIHYFELVEKAADSSVITAKLLGKCWGAGAFKILDFEISSGQRLSNNLHVLVQLIVDYHLCRLINLYLICTLFVPVIGVMLVSAGK